MKTKVSIIVPVYNVEQYLEKCLESLVNQTLKDIEIILINDGSPDNSEKIIKKYQKKYQDKIVYIKKENEGQGEARNWALKIAKGEYVTFVDSDDYINTKMLEVLYQKAKKENADIVATTKNIEITEEKEIIKQYNICNKEEYKNYILNNSGPWGKLIKKEIITKNNLYFPKLRAYEDVSVVPLWGMYANKIVFVDEPFYCYLIREGSTMKQTQYNEKLTHIYESLDKLYIKTKEHSKNKYNQELEWIYIEHLLHAASLRFLKFNKIDEIKHIVLIMKERFPNWNKNEYYKNMSLKYKIVCNLIYKEKIKLLKIILKNK